MRVFVTGASGFIGSAVVPELIGAGHQVLGLARSEPSAASLAAAGAAVHRGSLDDPGSLRAGAAQADGVIHLAFKHNFPDFTGAAEADLSAVETMGAVLEGSAKPFLVTSGTAALPHGRLGTEEDAPEARLPRVASEHATLALAERGVRASIVRLAPTVHGDGDHGFVPRVIDIARERGVSAYVGDGANRWPAVHRLDAARLYRLAVESAPGGSRLHGAGEEGVPFRDIAGVIGRQLNVPVVSIPPEEAEAHFGWLGAFVQIDNPTSSALTQERLGWRPVQPRLIADLEAGHYFGRRSAIA